jgi:CelD/BcsL family acetyltransferase involved in cellulose biosynthesis
MCLLTPRTAWRGPVPIRRLHLNTDGEDARERTCVEFNTVLARSECRAEVMQALADHLATQVFDELIASGMQAEALAVLRPLLAPLNPREQWSTDYYVDLAAIRATAQPYLHALSRNTRSQVTRSLRLYRERGVVTIEAARDVAHGAALFNELVDLHQQTWERRGQPGAFASARTRAFHERLIASGVPNGSVQLLRVSVGGQTVAVLYQFVDRGRVYFYQSGLRYEADNRFKPGLIAHALAVQFWMDRGLDEYDFLAGEDVEVRYKKSLANRSRRLVWVRFQRPRLKFSLFAGLRAIRRAVLRSG